VAVVAALNLTPETDPIVPIAGGPGQGAIEFYSSVSSTFEALRRNRDILLVDQRGTGESSRMDCVIEDDAILFQDQYSLEDTVEFIDECLEELPHDPRYFTTSVAVTDLEAARVALGYTSLNLYGVSYGSRVAQHFARRYPESTRTVIIDGVVPPQISLGPEIATESQRAVDTILARCAADTACTESFPDIEATFARVVAELRESSVQVLVPHPNTGRIEAVAFGSGQLAGAIRLLAYNPNTIALLPLMIHEAGEGNFVPLTSQFYLFSTRQALTTRPSRPATWARSSSTRSMQFVPHGPPDRLILISKYRWPRTFRSCCSRETPTRSRHPAMPKWPLSTSRMRRT
jgi:pimeloyl-ACP methyl ester carboxylesterase